MIEQIFERFDVSFLTAAGQRRRNHDGVTGFRRVAERNKRRRSAAIATAFSLIGTAGALANGPEWQASGEIAAVAEDFIRDEFGRGDRHLEPKAGYLDPRLKLPRCDAALEAFGRKGTRLSARTIVGVRCSGSRPWKVYVPVEVVIRRTVMVLKTSLPKGHLLTPADVVAERRDVARLTGAYVASLESIAGQRLKHAVTGGAILKPSMLAADKIVRRGQTVTLIVDADAMNIRMAGTALMDGALNQRIRVENPASGRIVEGLVRSPEYVEVLVQ